MVRPLIYAFSTFSTSAGKRRLKMIELLTVKKKKQTSKQKISTHFMAMKEHTLYKADKARLWSRTEHILFESKSKCSSSRQV